MNISSANSHPEPTHFERQLKRLARDVLRMGALVENSFRLSHQSLFNRDLAAAREIGPLDQQIDRFYRQIELDCAALMSMQAPAAKDLRQLSAFMQLVRDLERIGDYSKDLGEIAIKLFPYPAHACMPKIQEMSLQAQAMLAMSLAALADLDSDTGRRIKEEDDAVDIAYNSLYHTLADQRDVKGAIEPILLLVLVIRHLERMADHATNIGQRVFYIVTGQRF